MDNSTKAEPTPGPIGSEAYEQGRFAYNAGKGRMDNPFKFPESEHTAWLMGFNWERETDLATGD